MSEPLAGATINGDHESVRKRQAEGLRKVIRTQQEVRMYVRIAQFEGSAEDIDERIAEVRRRTASDEMGMRQYIARSMMLVDRETGSGASLILCESEDDLRKVDEIMNNATPTGSHQRTSVQMYEVAVDSEQTK